MTRKQMLLTLPLLVVWLVAAAQKEQGLLRKAIHAGWTFKQQDGTHQGKATVPGTIHTDLLAAGIIEDPYYRTNERNLQWIDKTGWIYETSFALSEAEANSANQTLLFEGLDTYAEVQLNGKTILTADNMFRRWEVSVKGIAHAGKNDLRVVFASPIQEGLRLLKAHGYPLMATNDQSENGGLGNQKVSVFTRKAGYHYGWDWGPRFVTSGIWRPVYFQAWNHGRIHDVFIRQPQVTAERANLQASIEAEVTEPALATVQVRNKANGKVLASRTVALQGGRQTVDIPFSIVKPALWWSRGLGEATLYTFVTELLVKGKTIASRETTTGLRSLKLVRKPDDRGESFYLELNGIPVFAKGANYIPNDVFLPRVTKAQYQRVVANAVKANMNMLRVWGGGIYEDDYFYRLCDAEGILVWQDFMFACSLYPGNEALMQSIKAEAEDNIIRLRNHPSIALWCGNNEIDAAWQYSRPNGGWGWKQQYSKARQDSIQATYLRIFHDILPTAVAALTDGDDYWPSSPMAGYEPNSHAGDRTPSGDIHYWGVWHGLHRFEAFEENLGRFMSEYGFQSFPEFETVKRYTIPADYDIESDVMAAHQRSGIGNLRIREYMGWYFPVPTDFEQFLYVGQLLQAYAISYAMETHRAAMPYCMGSLYWQINDCWPVASWSSTDYYQNWKAVHYAAARAYAPIMVRAARNKQDLTVHVVSDQLQAAPATLYAEVMDLNGKRLQALQQSCTVGANTSTAIEVPEWAGLYSRFDTTNTLVHLKLVAGKRILAEKIHFLAAPKYLQLPEPGIAHSIADAGATWTITVSTRAAAKGVWLHVPGQMLPFSDNYFDMAPGTNHVVQVPKNLSLADLRKKLLITSLQP